VQTGCWSTRVKGGQVPDTEKQHGDDSSKGGNANHGTRKGKGR